ncbi:hypothetical protein BH10BAC5_BH10BAC5_21610 [soil metagenome]
MIKSLKAIVQFFFMFCVILNFAIQKDAYSSVIPQALKPGDKVSDFTLSNYDNKSYTLSTSDGQATVIIFMSTECPFVQPYTSRLTSLANEFEAKGITFWGMNSNNTEDVASVKAHAIDKAYPFPVLKDNGNSVADLFGSQRTPEVFVVRNSDLVILYHGRIDDDRDESKVSNSDLRNALNEFVAGKDITVKETKSFGCGIKRKS